MLNHNDDQNEAKKMMLLCVAAASFVLLLFLVVLYMHDNKNTTKHVVKTSENNASEETDIEIKKSNLVSSDLDFWDMYEDDTKSPIEDTEDTEEEEKEKDKEKRKQVKKLKESSSSESKNDIESNTKRKKEKDEMDDGKHIKVTGSDGKTQWYEILENVKKNSFKFSDYLIYDDGLLKYSSSDVKSLIGIDISNKQGTIDFAKVKDAGVEFVMIKVASRGYETGQINIDDKFVEYANGATAASIPIGAYVTSQAITDVEAVEEANYAVAATNNYNVKYPIAIDFTTANEKQRTDKLTSEERTAIVKKFCETVKGYGKTPAIRADRDFLITSLDLEELEGYDIWLKDEAVTADYMRVSHIDNDDDDESVEIDEKKSSTKSDDNKSSSETKDTKNKSGADNVKTSDEEEPEYVGTDYPYEFKLWQYSDKGTINGINSEVNVNLSFVNYAER